MKKILFLAVVLFICNAASANAYFIDATLTADNHYGLFYGNADASSLTFVGRNEFGPWGSSGGYNWSHPESFSFDTGNNNYLYVLAWDDQTVAQSFIGQFVGAQGTIYSNATDWQYMVADGPNPGDYGNVPLLSVVQNDIATAVWNQPLATAANGSGPWGNIPGISPNAQFIWNDTFDTYATDSRQHYDIFRTQLPVSAVPEPMTIVLLGLGLVGAIVLKNKKKKSV